MTWIKTIPHRRRTSRCARRWRRSASSTRGVRRARAPDPATRRRASSPSHTLIPDALYHAFATFGALMSPDLPLTRRQHEMIATMVSVTNRCHY